MQPQILILGKYNEALQRLLDQLHKKYGTIIETDIDSTLRCELKKCADRDFMRKFT